MCGRAQAQYKMRSYIRPFMAGFVVLIFVGIVQQFLGLTAILVASTQAREKNNVNAGQWQQHQQSVSENGGSSDGGDSGSSYYGNTPDDGRAISGAISFQTDGVEAANYARGTVRLNMKLQQIQRNQRKQVAGQIKIGQAAALRTEAAPTEVAAVEEEKGTRKTRGVGVTTTAVAESEQSEQRPNYQVIISVLPTSPEAEAKAVADILEQILPPHPLLQLPQPLNSLETVNRDREVTDKNTTTDRTGSIDATDIKIVNVTNYWNLSCPFEWSKYSCVHQEKVHLALNGKNLAWNGKNLEAIQNAIMGDSFSRAFRGL